VRPRGAVEEELPLDEGRIPELRAALTGWYAGAALDYPWRGTQDPYAVLVSEVMLQQTRVATVLGKGYFVRWMAEFPTVAALAAADEDKVLRCWEGLGYYTRARNLQKTARAIVERHGGQFPGDPGEVGALPGIGRYTAGAVLSFALGQAAALVDGNVARVLARLFAWDGEVNVPAGQRVLWAWAERLVDPGKPREWNGGLMELGQRVCTPRRPRCDACPLRGFCLSAGPGAEVRPRRRSAPGMKQVTEHAIFACRNGQLLLTRETGTRRRGLWRLPLREECAVTDPPLPLLMRALHAVTCHRITYCVYGHSEATAGEGEEWIPLGRVGELPMSGPVRRVVNELLGSVAGQGSTLTFPGAADSVHETS
jgi:A/G-specific adenine glycosylase